MVRYTGERNNLLLRSVFIYPYLIGVLVGIHQVFEKSLLVKHRRTESLVVRSNLWLQTDHVEGKLLACDNTPDQFCERMLGSAGEKHSKGIFLLDAELHEVYLPSVNLCLENTSWSILYFHSTTLPML